MRKIDGILVLDKPCAMTSNAALQKVKRLYQAKKAGHTGSLDPIASGMLPICFGQATKFAQYLLQADKSYRVRAQLGVSTTTGDSEGDVVAKKTVNNIKEKDLLEVIAKFRGKIMQIPSMYSAIKHHGEPLYKLARQGITVERKAREVEIYKLELLDFANDIVNLEICCSKGTYIRTLVEDIGTELGYGAHVTALRRLSCGFYNEEEMISLEKLEEISAKEGQRGLDDLLLPLETAVANFAEVLLSEAAAYYLKQGQAVISPYAPSDGMVRLKMKDGRFLGVGEILADGKVAPRRLLF